MHSPSPPDTVAAHCVRSLNEQSTVSAEYFEDTRKAHQSLFDLQTEAGVSINHDPDMDVSVHLAAISACIMSLSQTLKRKEVEMTSDPPSHPRVGKISQTASPWR